MGHSKFPELGDVVEMHLAKDKVITKLTTGGSRVKREDGFVETSYHETQWDAIKSYKVFKRANPIEEDSVNY